MVTPYVPNPLPRWVAAVSRAPDKLDVFVAGDWAGSRTAAWEPHFGYDWQGWYRPGSETFPKSACISAVSCSLDRLDIFGVDSNGRIVTNTWSPGNDWGAQWAHVNGGIAAPGAPVMAVSRRPDFIDLFVVGSDGRVYTAWGTPGLGGWQGWQPIGDIRVPQGGAVTAVARNPDALDIFAVDVHSRVVTNAWSEGSSWWPEWRHIRDGKAVPGTYVSAVSCSHDTLNILHVGLNGHIYMAARESGFTDWFHGWWQIGDTQFPPGGHVTAVSRSPDLLDVFAVDHEGRVVTNAWSPGNDWWPTWRHINDGRAIPGAPVGVVSRSRDKLDVFVFGLDHYLYTAAWEPSFTNWFHGWRKLSPVGTKEVANWALEKFRVSSAPGVWPLIPKEELLTRIGQIVDNPYEVKQLGTALCGPAAIVFELVSRQPHRFVELCQALYETGECRGRSTTIRPSETLRQSRAHSGPGAAGWLLMASMRDVANAIFPVDADSNDFVGLSNPWEMKGWTYELLDFEAVSYESTTFYGEFEAMRRAESARNAGGVAFLLVHGAMLGNDEPWTGYPNHWVSFLGELHIDEGVWHIWDDGRIKFRCFSWGDSHSVDLDEGSFEDYMWGVVTAV